MAVRLTVAADGGAATVHVAGRLDAEGAAHLDAQLEELIADGYREVTVDLADATWASTPAALSLRRRGIDLGALRGQLHIRVNEGPLANVLADAGLERLLEAHDDAPPPMSATSWHPRILPERTSDAWRLPTTELRRGQYETNELDRSATLELAVIGEAGVADASVRGTHPRVVTFGARAFGLGLGALGADADSALHRGGEVVGLPGLALATPTDAGRVPDYLCGTERMPQVSLLSGLRAEGSFSHLVRFQPLPDADSVPMRELMRLALSMAGGQTVGMVIAAEVKGLLTATRRRAPSAHAGPAGFTPAALAEWLAYSVEGAWSGATVLLAGVLAKGAEPVLAPHLRPFSASDELTCHFHGACFEYTPLPARTVALRDLAAGIAETQALRSVAHIIFDPALDGRPGENALRRGLAWIGPVTRIRTP